MVKFYVTLDQPAHPRLRNNLRVDVAVVTGTRNDTLVVRRGALGRTNATHAFVVRGDEAVRVAGPLRPGRHGPIEILDGVERRRRGRDLATSANTRTSEELTTEMN